MEFLLDIKDVFQEILNRFTDRYDPMAPKWSNAPSPGDGEQYWVAFKDGHVDLCYAEPEGWSNRDTWEDFDHQVVAWMTAEIPAYP